MKRIIFLCYQNACRSQISEALVMKYFGDRLEAKSAGIEPTEVNPYVIRVLQEIGVETENLYSKHLKEFIN